VPKSDKFFVVLLIPLPKTPIASRYDGSHRNNENLPWSTRTHNNHTPNNKVEDLKVYEKDDDEMNEDKQTNVEKQSFWNKVECFIFFAVLALRWPSITNCPHSTMISVIKYILKVLLEFSKFVLMRFLFFGALLASDCTFSWLGVSYFLAVLKRLFDLI